VNHKIKIGLATPGAFLEVEAGTFLADLLAAEI
jgi:hypothetical protein